MKITLEVSRDQAIIIIAHSLSYDTPVKSQKAFKSEITNYFSMFGEQCLDDHQSECYKFEDEAELIVDKYYR